VVSFIFVFTILKAVGACQVIGDEKHLKRFAILRSYTVFLEVIVAAIVFALLTHSMANRSRSEQGIGRADILNYIYKNVAMILYVILDLHLNRVIASLANLRKARENPTANEDTDAHNHLRNVQVRRFNINLFRSDLIHDFYS